MIGKKINQLATELAPVSTDLTIIGDPDSGVSKKITLAQLGAIFSGAVSFYNDLASFPAVGDINVIYCAKDTQKLYLWSGSAYVEVFPSQALLDTYQLRSEKGNANGYASLDSGGKVPISQLPSSIMEYKGTWNASTNTPTLANGTGDTGDVYICNVAGTVNFGAGPITFAVGDYVIYSGSIWQRSSGAVGTVTSVSATITGDSVSISGSPVTTSGTLALTFNGTTSQYIRGNGTLANFPTSLVSGSGTANRLTKWSSTSGEIVNSNILDTGITITNLNATADFFSCQFNGNPTIGRSYGVLIAAGSNASDIAFRIEDVSSSSVYFYVWGDGRVQINNIPNATTDTDRFLVSDSGVIKYRTGAELLSDIGGASASGYVPYTGATANLDLGTHTLIAAKGTFSSSGSSDTVGITHSSGSGIALNITKGGNGEGLYINKTSGTGNAATIIGTLNATTLVKSGGTSSEFLKADGSVDSTSYGTGSVTSVGLSSATSGVTIGSTPITTSGTITLAIATASGSQQGLLSSTDWTTFNNKQNALTNPVTGTGTTNYLPKFTGASTIGNSIVQDNGTTVTISGNGEVLRLATSGTDNYIAFRNSSNVQIGDIGYDSRLTNVLSIWNNTVDGAILFGAGASQKMLLNASGNLSIGNTNDTYKLDVTGTGRFTSAVRSNGIEITNTANADILDIFQSPSALNSFIDYPSGRSLILRNKGSLGSLTLASTGAATFSSSVTATSGKFASANGTTYAATPQLRIDGNGVNNSYAQIIFTDSALSDGKISYFPAAAAENRYFSISPRQVESDFVIRGSNVGIGTTSPNTILDVNGTINVRTNGFEFGRITTNNVTGNIGGLTFQYNSSGTFTTGMVLNGGGNVGIGTTSPAEKLSVIGNIYANGGFSSYRIDGGIGLDVNGGDLGAGTYIARFKDYSNNAQVVITGNGRLGIGTTSPGSKLSIVGLPTSSAGLSSGDIYVAAGVLMIV
jgi:hypothetical protein